LVVTDKFLTVLAYIGPDEPSCQIPTSKVILFKKLLSAHKTHTAELAANDEIK